jgi:diaminopimelate decarboxylase
VSFRVNPDVDPKTHPYISTGLKGNKFGIPYAEAVALYRKAASLPHLDVAGLDCHIGSQITQVSPFADALDKVLALLDTLTGEGIAIRHLDLGGGLGIRYRDETPPSVAEYAQALLGRLAGRGMKLLVEPGRALVGNAGLLLTRVEYLKHGETKNFAIVDAAMNDLMRPALYDAYHEILPVIPKGPGKQAYEIVGPVCESGDFLGHDRVLELAEGDLLAVMSAGAYGMSMSSNYNTRARAAEVMVDGDTVHLVRQRETIEQIFALETVLP